MTAYDTWLILSTTDTFLPEQEKDSFFTPTLLPGCLFFFLEYISSRNTVSFQYRHTHRQTALWKGYPAVTSQTESTFAAWHTSFYPATETQTEGGVFKERFTKIYILLLKTDVAQMLNHASKNTVYYPWAVYYLQKSLLYCYFHTLIFKLYLFEGERSFFQTRSFGTNMNYSMNIFFISDRHFCTSLPPSYMANNRFTRRKSGIISPNQSLLRQQNHWGEHFPSILKNLVSRPAGLPLVSLSVSMFGSGSFVVLRFGEKRADSQLIY